MSKIYLSEAIFVNRAPFENIHLKFNENEIANFTGINGIGKTTVMSHIADAFYEMAKVGFQNEFENKSNKFYRVSDDINNLDILKGSFVYLRFIYDNTHIDYLCLRGKFEQIDYDKLIPFSNKIPLNPQEHFQKNLSSDLEAKKVQEIFKSNVLTYFPSYRFETPGYLNEQYKNQIKFNLQNKYAGYLPYSIEIISGMKDFLEWLMNYVLDFQLEKDEKEKDPNPILHIWDNINDLISNILISKVKCKTRFGLGSRQLGFQRIQIANNELGDKNYGSSVYRSIFNLSSGESGLLSLFGNIIRCCDIIEPNQTFENYNGIVIIDEIDKHLHIKLQKEILPKLLHLFPNIQFIISSHSPFLLLGLAELEEKPTVKKRTKIKSLVGGGFDIEPRNEEQYEEVYNMMIGEDENWKKKYDDLDVEISKLKTPSIICTGKTDPIHLKSALKYFHKNEEFEDVFESFFVDLKSADSSDSTLNAYVQTRKKENNQIPKIAIFDRDDMKTIKNCISENELEPMRYKDNGNNIHCLVIPKSNYFNDTNISIEFLYSEAEIKSLVENRRLYLGNEFSNKSGKLKINKSVNLKNNKNGKFVIVDSDVFDENDTNIALSKNNFAEAVYNGTIAISNESWENFRPIFKRIDEIINRTPTN